ncbi:MAG: cell division protein FtsW, partial [Armatimonadetes bacterium]|nr:cell division protein FtsW [Armatimonadota bacterium]
TQGAHAVLGGLLCLFCSHMPPERFRAWAKYAFVASIFLMLLVFTPLGVEMGGARRWVRIGPLMFQPSEPTKIALILYLARCVTAARDWPKRQLHTYAAAMLSLGLVCGICLLQRDMGSAVVIFCFGLAVIFFAGLRWWAVALTWAGASVVGFYLAWVEPYRWRRITAFLHPTRDTDDTAYHVIRMLITCARGGLIGPGPGISREKWLALPARHTDAIFCVIASELGFIGAATLVLVFLLFLYRGLALARLQPDRYSAILLASLVTAIVLQAFVNMGVATGLLPCTGITLPFISAGGSSLVMTLVASGMILSLSRQARIRRKEAPAECPQAA